jgi:hypothetical protein
MSDIRDLEWAALQRHKTQTIAVSAKFHSQPKNLPALVAPYQQLTTYLQKSFAPGGPN